MEQLHPETAPKIIDDPVDESLQTGESALLGGGMSIHAPYSNYGKTE